jgi:hypothetical protein
MSGLALIISIIALIFAYNAYRKSGGSIDELKAKVEELGITTETLRSKTADTLGRLEKKIRGENRQDKDETDSRQTTGNDTTI